jgi:Domain of unknown function (DUF4461)
MTPLPPSVYISRLRRAFFLRVHPDRFRSQGAAIQQQQAKLVQALNDRMSWPDFISYNYGNSGNMAAPSRRNATMYSELHYVLEHHDGSFVNQSIKLNASVENILHAMNQALKESGAASLPPLPKCQYKPPKAQVQSPDDNIAWAQESQPNSGTATNIDHRFDMNTTKGRDLLAFCDSLDRQQVEERRQHRMDANAAAMMGRRLYQFQSIDGLSLHWSSRSFAILLHSLIQLHEEHRNKFLVDSFYPLRLVFTSIDYSFEEALDLYGGVLHLHPGYTPLQWLEILRQVTPERLRTMREHRYNLDEAQRKMQSTLGVRLKKGFTCSSEDYFNFVLNLAHHLPSPEITSDGIPATTTSAVALETITVTVESADVCRFRSVVTKEGQIRVGVRMSVDSVLSAIHRDSEMARQRRDQDRQEVAISEGQAKQVQFELGLTRKVYKAGTFRISHDDFQKCLTRIVNLDSSQKGRLKQSLGGNALGVAGSGQFCQLGDDGAVIIPHDWSVSGTETASAWAFA